MITFEHNKDLTSLTTFAIPARARLYAEYADVKDLIRITRSDEYNSNNVFHIGGGSNLLFDGEYDGLILKSKIKGRQIYRKDDKTVYVIAGASENWSDFVDWCVENGLGGLENLAGIPGEVGASAVQNVGAYGVEAGDRIFSVECFDSFTRKVVTLKPNECRFGYRTSVFKTEAKGRYYVLRVSYLLTPSDESSEYGYGPLKSFAEKLGRVPTIGEIADEVKRIRDSKLPNPAEIGSAGSFFKNPVINEYYFNEEVLRRNPDVPSYKAGENLVKVPAGWLIEQAGFKGKVVGGAQVYPKQCLVLVNKDNASAQDVLNLSNEIIKTVNEKFGIMLEPEVNIISTKMKITILGSGTSKGVPEIACGCRVCRSHDMHDKRLRASALVEVDGQNLLIDVTPDFRQQALRCDLHHLDGVLITHSHYDHVGGFDDLRPFCFNGPVTVYLRHDVNDDLHRRLDYCFKSHLYPGVPVFDMKEISRSPFYINGTRSLPIEVKHGKLPIVGYRIGDFAYLTDVKTISDEEKSKLFGLKGLVINALRRREHFAHLSLSEALALIDEVKPEQAWLTHFSHEMGLHSEVESMLPENVYPCYDGLEIEIK